MLCNSLGSTVAYPLFREADAFDFFFDFSYI
jgi:hypothetical protein